MDDKGANLDAYIEKIEHKESDGVVFYGRGTGFSYYFSSQSESPRNGVLVAEPVSSHKISITYQETG
jgi:hypothetical protein